MCERSPLGLPHTQNRMSGRPQVAEITAVNFAVKRRAGQEGGAGGQGSCTSCVCAGRRRSSAWVRVWTRKHVLITHPGGTQARADHDPCAHRPGPQHILLTRIAVPVQWRCRQSESRKSLHGRISWRPRVFQLLHLPSRTMECRARTTCCDWMRMIWWYCAAS